MMSSLCRILYAYLATKSDDISAAFLEGRFCDWLCSSLLYVSLLSTTHLEVLIVVQKETKRKRIYINIHSTCIYSKIRELSIQSTIVAVKFIDHNNPFILFYLFIR